MLSKKKGKKKSNKKYKAVERLEANLTVLRFHFFTIF
ncbi:MAG: hypothetical protein MRECE_34c012 [Mycoplasmataceae bacterium CE_OT135]|nr:MAG: hypothetical protein MRECE_34c012 [Mycoplasmataceae bacterium CE_OT135]